MYTTLKTLNNSFITNPEHWLGNSVYFDKLFSGKWADEQEDGSFFIETDAHVFEHILRYLRTGVLPIFYDSTKGHDFTLYHALLGEAEYFGIERLCKWLLKKKYLDAVKVNHIATETMILSAVNKHTLSTGGHANVSMTPVTQRESCFYCPIGKHHQSDEKTCKRCIERAVEEKINLGGGWRNEDSVKWCIVRKEITFDYDLCVNAFLEEKTT